VRKGLVLSVVALALGMAAHAQDAQQATVNRYCAGCHNERLKSGNFSWAKVDLTHVDRSAEQAERAIRMMHAGMMPPPGAPRPDAAATNALVSYLENGIDRAAGVHPYPGAPALHRLNRNEYRNSIRDLLGLDVDVASLLPPDDMSHGFDNMSDVLRVSPALMEGYIRAGDRISREAVGDRGVSATTKTYHIARVVSQMRHVEGTPFGTRGGLSVIHDFPADGEYVFRLSLYYDICGPLWGKSQGKGQQIEVAVNGERVALVSIDPNWVFTDDIVTAPVKVTAGPKNVSASFIQKAEGPVEDVVMPFEQSLIDFNNADLPGITSLPHLRELRIVGPKNVTGISETPSRRKLFTCRPTAAADEVACAKKIVSALTRQAYRRPVTDADLEDLLSVYQHARNSTSFEEGIRSVVQTIITDPEFLFRFERTPPSAAAGANYRISDLELASRLSYFLWSSAPDDELIAVAAQGKLHEPQMLERQTRRMLADPKSEAISKIFAAQWLNLQNLQDAQPDAFLFPNFDRNLADSMRRETELFFDSIVREDRSVLDLLTANYTFMDEVLAKNYHIPNILGSRFRRVTLTDENRFGLLGQGSILTLTSVSNRTSPVQRGKWVMIVLFGTPPPPPPAVVPALKENEENGKMETVRERMEQHRKNEPCHSCHQLMDPIGLALEKFDAVGAWRTKDSGLPIDSESKMFDGTKLDGPVSLRNAIMSHQTAFIGSFTERLLAYGLGRVVDYRDMPMVRSIEKEAAQNNNRFSAFVLSIVRSVPFQMRQADDSVTEPTAAGGK
jgi:cytochrome c551/c552